MYSLNMYNSRVRNVIVNLIGDIYLYAKANSLRVVRAVRNIALCFRKKDDEEFVRRHGHFVSEMFRRTDEGLRKIGFDSSSSPELFFKVAELLDGISNKQIEAFVAVNEKLLAIHESGMSQRWTRHLLKWKISTGL